MKSSGMLSLRRALGKTKHIGQPKDGLHLFFLHHPQCPTNRTHKSEHNSTSVQVGRLGADESIATKSPLQEPP